MKRKQGSQDTEGVEEDENGVEMPEWMRDALEARMILSFELAIPTPTDL